MNTNIIKVESTAIQPLPERVDFLREYAKIIVLMRDKRLLTKHGTVYATTTIHNYKCNLIRLFHYAHHLGISTIYCDDITFKWVEDYRHYLINLNYSRNAVAAIIANFRSVASRLHRMGLVQTDGSGIICTGEQVTTVFLDLNDIKMLIEYDFSDFPGHQRVRDIFVIQCFLGLRIKDMMKFIREPESYLKEKAGRMFVEFKTGKTGEVVWIPIGDKLFQLISKYVEKGTRFSDQYYNYDIKSICNIIFGNRRVMFSRTHGGERRDTLMPFHQLVSSHTARRSFATNAYLSGINPLDIMKITGHKTFDSFMKYIRCDSLTVANKIWDEKFFQDAWQV